MENSLILCEVLHHTEQTAVWCAVSYKRIVGALFFESTVDGEIFVQQFVALLELDEHDRWFQQDGATSHTVNETVNVLQASLVTVSSLKTCGHDVPLI